MKLARLFASGAMAALLVASTPPAHATTGPPGTLSSDAEAFGVRVEYDIPLPAGTGTAPHVVGDTSRQNGSDSAHGLAAAPSQLDAVVGGQYVDPNGINGGQPQRALPQAECYSPGANLDTVFRFPTDTQSETRGVPATSVAVAQCAPGPMLMMHAEDTAIGAANTPSAAFGVVMHSGMSTADGSSAAVHNQLVSDSAAFVSNLDILGGVIHIGSVTVNGHSAVTGKPGGGATSANVTFSGMTIAGVPAELRNDQLTLAGQTAPVDSALGQALIAQLNAGLAASGCKATVLAHPSDYPQGFLLARKPPDLGVAADGHLAASMAGGMLFVCDLPQAITAKTGGLSPQRVQILVGFAFTSVQAVKDVGGFNLGDLGSTTGFGSGNVTPVIPVVTAPAPPTAQAVTVSPVASPPPPTAVPIARPTQLASPVVRVGHYKLDPTLRALLFVLCLLGWLGLTFVGLRAVRGVTAG